MGKGFIIGTSAVLATAGLLAGGVALNNKFAKDKITIKHGDSVLVGDKDKAPVDALIPDNAIPPEQKLMCQEFAERTNSMVVSIVNYGSEYLTIETYTSDYSIYDVVQEISERCRGSLYRTNLNEQYDKAFITFNGELISVQDMEEILPEKMVEFKAGYYEFNVIGDYYGRVIFEDLDGTYFAETEDGYFHTDTKGIIQAPPTAKNIDGYTFVGWSTEKDNIDKVIDLTAHVFSFANISSVYPIYTDANGQVLPSAITITLHAGYWGMNIHGAIGESSITLSRSTLNDYNLIAGDVTFAGFTTDQSDISNLQDSIELTESCEVWAVYKNKNTQELLYTYQVQSLDIQCGETVKTLIFNNGGDNSVVSYFTNFNISQFIDGATDLVVISIVNITTGETINPNDFNRNHISSGCLYEINVGTQEDFNNFWG